MFSIYDIEGRPFRDNLEALRRVKPVDAGRASPRGADPEQEQTSRWEHPLEEREQGDLERAESEAGARRSPAPPGLRAYREMLQLPEREELLHAYQVMSSPVITIGPDVGLQEAWRLLHDHDVRQMPVVDARRRLVGMIADRDLLRLLIVEPGRVQHVPGKRVADAMAREVVATDPVSEVRRVARVLLDYRLAAVPVVDERDALVGIVSRSDILRAVSGTPPLSLWS